MAKRRKKRGKGARSKPGAAPAGRNKPGASSSARGRGTKASSATGPAPRRSTAGDASDAQAARPAPDSDRLPKGLIAVIGLLFGVAVASGVSLIAPPPVGTVLPHTGSLHEPPTLGVLCVAFVAAGAGLVLRRSWGWWLASLLAFSNIFLNLLAAILANTAATAGGLDPDLLVLGATLRLILWTGVGLQLQSYRVVSVFQLSWDREQERKRTHQILTGALVLTAAAWLL